MSAETLFFAASKESIVFCLIDAFVSANMLTVWKRTFHHHDVRVTLSDA